MCHKEKIKMTLIGFNINVMLSLYNSRLDGIAFGILEMSELYMPCQ